MLRRCPTLQYRLLVVESPSKATKIGSFLGKDGWQVVPSRGHIRHMTDFDQQTFETTWEWSDADQQKRAQQIAMRAKKAEQIVLGTDPDREGELIADHLQKLFREGYGDVGGGITVPIQRICLREITDTAVRSALRNPSEVNACLAQAAIARGIMDMWFGFSASQVLREHNPGCRSAGRVQSPALRLVCDRDRQRSSFTSIDFFTIPAKVVLPGGIKVSGSLWKGGSVRFAGDSAAAAARSEVAKSKWVITQVVSSEKTEAAAECWDTAACVSAARSFGMDVSQATKALQELYEAGMVTYIRTDSTRISDEARESLKQYVAERWGKEHVAGKTGGKKKKAAKDAAVQDAHEAIRPTDVNVTPEDFCKRRKVPVEVLTTKRPKSAAAAKGKGGQQQPEPAGAMQARVYNAIWRQTVRSVCEPPRARITQLCISPKGAESGELCIKIPLKQVLYPGCIHGNAAADSDSDQECEAGAGADALRVGDAAQVTVGKPAKSKTSPPVPMTDSELIRTLKAKGIGRPSTYESIVRKLTDMRGYAELNNGVLASTEAGRIATEFLEQNFARWVDYPFTSRMESALDDIAEGRASLSDVLASFRADIRADMKNCPRAENWKLLGEDPKSGLNVWAHTGTTKGRPWCRLRLGDVDVPSTRSAFAGPGGTPELERAVELLHREPQSPQREWRRAASAA
eukprot:TRINITY_DN50232_c0_g1_i1.p1 TRINITY_DN50232_c0_g1~~TRINITY_DN50232_c0_g1_i1.p1  ORF type:complete len:712 (+),score=207.82 TRINITY_DN50232_c0_g1_i1:77-2137(+)